jgi:hypothetical protein
MTPAELRRAMAAGIAFIVLYVVGVLVSFNNAPNIKSHDSAAVAAAKFHSKLSDSGARTGLLIGGYVLIVAALLFVWFTRALGQLVASPAAGRVIDGFGVVGAASITVGAMTSAGMAGAISFGDEKVPQDGDTVRVVMDLAFPFLFVIFGLTVAAIIATIAVRGAGLASWLRYTAWLGVLGGIVAVIFLPMVLPLLWFLAVAIVVLRRPVTAAIPAQTVPASALT